MYKGDTIGVVVPAYNESGFVGDVITTLPQFVDRAYVVDDCSTDGTWDEIQRAAAQMNHRPSASDSPSMESTATEPQTGDPRTDASSTDELPSDESTEIHADGGQVFAPRIVTIRHEKNRGVGGAIKTGYHRAREDGLDVVAVMNGDGQMDPGILDRIVEPVVSGRAEFAKGNRLTRRAHRETMSAWRLFGNVLLTFLTKAVSGYWRMNDPQNGYTAISNRALETIDLDRLYDDYGFCNDLLVHLNVHELPIEDVEMESRYGNETSHIKYSRFVPKLSWLLARRAAWRYHQKYVLTDFHPLVFLILFGTMGLGLGSLFVGWSLVATGLTPVAGLLSTLVVMLAGLFLTLAMIFDRVANEKLESRVTARPRGGSE